MVENRTKNAILNSSITLFCQMMYLVVSFICRTVFTKTLGAEYLGVSGLFSNILTILSFAELGIGSALVYRMYEPLATDDREKLCQYVQLYKNIYRLIISVILIAGIAVIPFMGYIVQAPDIKENITLLYILYLAQTLVTYFFVYKKSILIADQKSYVVNVYTQVFNILMNVAQCIFLAITHDFIIYCVLNIGFNLANNVVCSYRANREYPYINEKPKTKLSNAEIKSLYTDVKGLLLTKVAGTAFSGTDNIFISAFIGIRYVGVLSNYTVFSTIVNGVMNKIFDAVTASVGNLVVSGQKNKTEGVLKKLFFLNTSLYGYFCLGMIVLLREFVMTIWLDAEYDLSQTVVTLVIIELFLRSIHYPVYMTRNAMGCFSEYKTLFAASAVLNIILDYILVKPLGISGLYIATIICRGITYLVDIWVVYHQQLQRSVWNYLRMLLIWVAFLLICGVTMIRVTSWMRTPGISGFILRVAVVTVIYWLLYVLTFSHSEEFKYYLAMLKGFICRKKRVKL